MDDLERRIRNANPSTAARGDALSERAENELSLLLAGAENTPERRSGRSRALVPLFGLAAAILAFSLVVTTTAPHAAVAATPPPLTYDDYPLDATEALHQMSESASSRPDTTPSTQTIRMQSWALNITDDGESLTSFILPEVVTITRAPDGARSILVQAGQPYDEAGQVATDPDAPEPGTELWSESNAAGEYRYLFPEPPPAEPEALQAYLARYGGARDGHVASDVVDAVTELMLEWQLTPAQESAMLLLLSQLPGIEVLGTTNDRLGRAGVAFRTPDVGGYHRIVVADEAGRILSIENVYTGGQRPDLPSPAVVAYFAWERD